MNYATTGVSREDVERECGIHITLQEFCFVAEYVKDFNAARAALAVGKGPTTGAKTVKLPQVVCAVDLIVGARLTNNNLDAAWILNEMLDNHRLARLAGNITASNTALNLLAKHVTIDAFAAVKMDGVDSTVGARLQRGRDRAAKRNKVITFK